MLQYTALDSMSRALLVTVQEVSW